MNDSVLRSALTSGSVASLLSAIVLASRGRHETPHPAAPLNAVGHWLYGDRAFRIDRPTWRHTGVGMAIHHASAVFWGVLQELLLRRIEQRDRAARRRDRPRTGTAVPGPADRLATAAVVTGIAALTDLRLVPPRLSPGFEHRLRPASVAWVYVAFGAGLALGAALSHRSRRHGA